MLSIKAQSGEDRAESLSGGNQQKVVISKLLTCGSRIIIMDEPTKGVDVGSKAAIYQIMCDLAAEGFGILMVSSDMPEVLNLCDRALVMREGRISAVFTQKWPEALLKAAMPLEKPGKERPFMPEQTRSPALWPCFSSTGGRPGAILIILFLLVGLRNPAFTTGSNALYLRRYMHHDHLGAGHAVCVAGGSIDISITAIMALGAMTTGIVMKNNLHHRNPGHAEWSDD